MKRHRNPRPRLSKPASHNNDPAPRRDHEDRARLLDHGLNHLREAVGRTDALADAVFREYDERRVGDEDARVEERVSYLIDITAESASKALEELDQLREELEDTSSAEGAA